MKKHWKKYYINIHPPNIPNLIKIKPGLTEDKYNGNIINNNNKAPI